MSANVLNVFGQESSGQPASAVTSMMLNRQAQEVQAAMIIAKRFPRDERASGDRILAACSRRSLAESAIYEYPRGDKIVTGASIRLAESLAQNWGNIDFGIIELEQRAGESQVMSYAWDLETNTRQSKIFTVPHIRHTKNGDKPLTDPRDIYEMVANQGARRLRSCILGVIPGDVIEMAVQQCEITLRTSSKDPLEVRIKNMVERFNSQFQVTSEMLSHYIGRSTESFTEADFIRLVKVYRSLKDSVIGREYFLHSIKDEAGENSMGNPAAQSEAGNPTPEAAGTTAKPIPTPKNQVSLDAL